MRFINRSESKMEGIQEVLSKKKKYNCTEVKEYLYNTYKDVCAYCETKVSPSNYMDVEHFHPKCHYQVYKLDLHNLHLSCKKCNLPKGATITPILSPNFYKIDPSDYDAQWCITNSSEMQQKLQYCGYKLYSPISDETANFTIKLLGLNGDEPGNKRIALINDRMSVYCSANNTMKSILFQLKNYIENLNVINYNYSFDLYLKTKNAIDPLIQDLLRKMKHGEAYSQMIIDNFKVPLYQLMRIIFIINPKHDCSYADYLRKIDLISKSLDSIHLQNYEFKVMENDASLSEKLDRISETSLYT